jgi:hypothetical protein
MTAAATHTAGSFRTNDCAAGICACLANSIAGLGSTWATHHAVSAKGIYAGAPTTPAARTCQSHRCPSHSGQPLRGADRASLDSGQSEHAPAAFLRACTCPGQQPATRSEQFYAPGLPHSEDSVGENRGWAIVPSEPSPQTAAPKLADRPRAAGLPLKNVLKSSLIIFPSTRGAKLMGERPEWRALGRIVLPATGADASRTIEADENFFWDGVPNSAMLPLNRLSRAAKLRFLDAHWRETRPQQITRLARSLGYTSTDGAAACTFIENWIARETQIEKEPTP